jgi:uncharacterized protein involved in exopolysaccharide biosynthesis
VTYVQSTAETLKHAADTVWRHRLLTIVSFAVFMSLAVVFIAMTPRIYRVGASVLIVNGNARNDPTLASPDLPTLATSTGVLTRVSQRLGLKDDLPALRRGLTAKAPAYRSGVMRIEFADASADHAATVANGVADELSTYYNELSTARYDEDLRQIDAELTKQKKAVQRIDAQLKARGGLQLVSGESDKGDGGLLEQLEALRTQRAMANADLQGDAAQADVAGGDVSTRGEIARREILDADPLYKSLQAEATASATQLASARAQFTDRYPGMQQLKVKDARLRAALNTETARALSAPHAFSPSVAAAAAEQRKAQAAVEADRAKVAALDGEVQRRSQEMNRIAPLELLRIERDAAMAEYKSTAAHRDSTVLDRADALSLGSVVVIDRALASEAQAGVGPIRLAVVFGFLSLLLALGCALLAEQLDPRLRRVAHIESLYGRPVVATLGKYR